MKLDCTHWHLKSRELSLFKFIFYFDPFSHISFVSICVQECTCGLHAFVVLSWKMPWEVVLELMIERLEFTKRRISSNECWILLCCKISEVAHRARVMGWVGLDWVNISRESFMNFRSKEVMNAWYYYSPLFDRCLHFYTLNLLWRWKSTLRYLPFGYRRLSLLVMPLFNCINWSPCLPVEHSKNSVGVLENKSNIAM